MGDHCHHQGCQHENIKDDLSKGENSLYSKLDHPKIQCLNELIENSGKEIFKPFENRLDKTQFVESDVDEELLVNIPFLGNVKLKSIVVLGGEGTSHPSEIRLFKNRPTMSFDDTQVEADQTFKLHPDPNGKLDYTLKATIFSSIYHLTIYIPKNYGSTRTKVYYIGLFGDFLRPFRQEIILCNYEASANPCDHKVKEDVSNQMQIR
ncbi:unnamed protein product [Gordionus sp. m RMFG-2023]